ncbi:TIGR02450 family Trp-rich protein [Pseudomonas sp. KB-10]|uniref:TIGR02450 family Trp-rich protein n=1 Tax=Pseudomonas sp. KB-10 TaxID=2292264 RepID=UPI001BAE6722|nr:TIGR02450 family Trp-rich protein [Pseudomonas sp. KB-10]
MTPFNDKPGKRRLNRRKLLLSKWTAAQPQNRERHFLVTELIRDEADTILGVELQAVLTQRSQQLDWRQLQDTEHWLQGWR